MDIFAPKNFDEFVGQKRAKKIAGVIVTAAQMQHKPLPNILIDGPYGTGKTSLAKVIAYETHQKVVIIDAASVNKNLPDLSKLTIIDEIHNLDPIVADSLNVLMDKGKARIIGCTTNPGKLSGAFKSRFRQIHLEQYSNLDIQHILSIALATKGLDAPGKVLQDISKRSRRNPRTGLNYLSFVLDYLTISGGATVAPRLSQEAFQTLGVNASGFTDRDFAYMNALPNDRTVGVHYLSSVLGIDPQTIEAEIEPYLLQSGYIERMPRGRIKLKELH